MRVNAKSQVKPINVMDEDCSTRWIGIINRRSDGLELPFLRGRNARGLVQRKGGWRVFLAQARRCTFSRFGQGEERAEPSSRGIRGELGKED